MSRMAVGAKTAASPVHPERSLVGQSVGMKQKFDFMLHMQFSKSRFTSAFPQVNLAVVFISEYTATALNSASVRSASVSIFAYRKPKIVKSGFH